MRAMQNIKSKLLDECTRDGSLDWHGKPAIKRKTGGWKSGMLLLGMFVSVINLVIRSRLKLEFQTD